MQFLSYYLPPQMDKLPKNYKRDLYNLDNYKKYKKLIKNNKDTSKKTIDILEKNKECNSNKDINKVKINKDNEKTTKNLLRNNAEVVKTSKEDLSKHTKDTEKIVKNIGETENLEKNLKDIGKNNKESVKDVKSTRRDTKYPDKDIEKNANDFIVKIYDNKDLEEVIDNNQIEKTTINTLQKNDLKDTTFYNENNKNKSKLINKDTVYSERFNNKRDNFDDSISHSNENYYKKTYKDNEYGNNYRYLGKIKHRNKNRVRNKFRDYDDYDCNDYDVRDYNVRDYDCNDYDVRDYDCNDYDVRDYDCNDYDVRNYDCNKYNKYHKIEHDRTNTKDYDRNKYHKIDYDHDFERNNYSQYDNRYHNKYNNFDNYNKLIYKNEKIIEEDNKCYKLDKNKEEEIGEKNNNICSNFEKNYKIKKPNSNKIIAVFGHSKTQILNKIIVGSNNKKNTIQNIDITKIYHKLVCILKFKDIIFKTNFTKANEKSEKIKKVENLNNENLFIKPKIISDIINFSKLEKIIEFFKVQETKNKSIMIENLVEPVKQSKSIKRVSIKNKTTDLKDITLDPRYLHFIKKACGLSKTDSSQYLKSQNKKLNDRAKRNKAIVPEFTIFKLKIKFITNSNTSNSIKNTTSSKNTLQLIKNTNLLNSTISNNSIENTPISNKNHIIQNSITGIEISIKFKKNETYKVFFLERLTKIADIKPCEFNWKEFEYSVYKYGNDIEQHSKAINLPISDSILIYYLFYHQVSTESSTLVRTIVERDWTEENKQLFELNFKKHGNKLWKYQIGCYEKDLELYYRWFCENAVTDIWSKDEKFIFDQFIKTHKGKWKELAEKLPGKNAREVKQYYTDFYKKYNE